MNDCEKKFDIDWNELDKFWAENYYKDYGKLFGKHITF
jgi:hypothetical protein